MAIKLMAKVSLLLLMQLLVPCVYAGSWQSCHEVSVAKCGVGDSRSGGHEYRYDIGPYRYKWTKYPHEASSYNGPFKTVALSQVFQSCQVCSNETRPTQGGPTLNPSLQSRTNIMIVDNNVGTLGTDKAEILSQIPCGRRCRLWFVGCNLTTIEVGAFAKLPQVSTLVIWRSNVQTLKNGTFAGMEGLEYLLMLENNLTHLEDGCFHGLPRLSYLVLVDNQILTLTPGTFLGLEPRWFDVSANHITNVAPGTLQAIKPVEYVRFAQNKLRSIDAAMFHGLERLGVLNLEGNKISHIAYGAFHANTKLHALNLADNRLTFLPGGWFKSSFPSDLVVYGNGVAAIALEGRGLFHKKICMSNRPRCTCANDWLYENGGGTNPKYKQRYRRVIRAASCPALALMRNLSGPVDYPSDTLPCPPPLVEIVTAERIADHKYRAVGRVYWEQLPQVSWTFPPNDSRHSLDMTYDKDTTTHDSLATGNLTVRVVTDLKAEGWVKCKGPEKLFGETGNHSLCSNYMGRSSFTLWLETAEPLSFGNTTCTASSETGSDTAVFAASARAHSDTTTLQATELPHTNTTPHSASIPSTPLSTSTSHDGHDDSMCSTLYKWYKVLAVSGWLMAVVEWPAILLCAWCVVRGSKAPGNGAGPPRNGDQVNACSRWPLSGGNSDGSVISPYAEGRFEDHDSSGVSVISPYAEGGFQDHPDLRRAGSSRSEAVPYGQAKLGAAYAARPRAQTHPVPSRPYNTERPRQTPNRERAVVAGYGQNGSDKSGGKNCYQHPVILPNQQGATKAPAYQQNAGSGLSTDKAACYNSPSLSGATKSPAYPQNASGALRSDKGACYNSPSLARHI
ncbi:PREDICTED: uncharacterized protein LOC109461566 [Branchiostoma belcheri]|uniref:Uncharacterized protein LOC109461566 n=1 Tax=Branchiostoma belcheri TaxID=7741 RepID=A0A6P4Y4A4_BRABE|nr:PREDICTED: uncharacterized protein LOC109461566 [Branchiostoma belcheri]